jgi:hypothetical protein
MKTIATFNNEDIRKQKAMSPFGLPGKPFARKPTIHVKFINGKDNSVFAASDMLPEQLPDTFALNTNLDIKGEKWSVVSTDPLTKSDFLKTGKLSIVLSKIVKMPPGDLLYSLSTISDDIGAVAGDTLPGEDVFSIHEDDWRQAEFVAQGYEKLIDEEFADIHNIRVNEWTGTGFKKLHVRVRIPEPLQNCTLADVEALIPQPKKFVGVGFLRTQGIVPHSFAWMMNGGLVIWGVTDDAGNIMRLCLSGAPEKKDVAAVGDAFSKLTHQYGLYFVDWRKEVRIQGDASAFERYFEGQ